MTGVSDIGKQLATQFMLRALRQDMNDAQTQAGTGKKSTTVGGLGTLGASSAIAFRSKNEILEAYTNNLNQAKAKLTIMDQSMQSITDSARDVLTNLRSQLQNTDPKASILRDNAQGILNSMMDKLNTQLNGRYLFSGDDIFNAPMNNLAGLNASLSAQIPGWLAGTTPAGVVADARTVTGTGLGLSSGMLASGNVSFSAGDDLSIDYTVKLDQSGFADVLRGMAIIANLPAPTTQAEQDNYWNVINGVITLLDEGAKRIDEYQGQLGNKANLVDDLVKQHSASSAAFEELIGSIEDVDMADASVRFQQLQIQLQASYSAIAQVRQLSLVNFL